MEFASSLSELLHNLDATTYFFVSCGLFVGIVAVVFFILGWWFGGLLWRRYKRRWRAAEATIESLKNEAAQLKRRIAGQSARSPGASSSLGLQEPLSQPAGEGESDATPLPLPLGQPFTLWTLPLEESETAPLPGSRAFTLWTEPPTPKAVGIAELLSGSSASESAFATTPPLPSSPGFTAPLLFPSQPAEFPMSKAFSLWTEEGWEAIPTLIPPPPVLLGPSTAFTLWTTEDVRPAHVRLSWPPSAAFTLWTRTDYTPFPTPGPLPAPVRSQARDALIAATASAVRSVASRSHPAEPQVTFSFPEEEPAASSRSRAFTLWTQSSSSPTQGGIAQRSALASLIRSRVEPPPLPPLPPLDVEPLPFVPAAGVDTRAL